VIRSSHRTKILAVGGLGVAGVAVLTAGVVIALRGSSAAPMTAGTATMALRAAGRHDAAPLEVVSMSPASGANGISGDTPIKVTFTSALNSSSAMPQITPAVPGVWTMDGTSAVFTPSQPFAGDTQVTVRVTGGSDGPRSDAGGEVPQDWSSSYTTRSYSVLRLQQILAQLGYLPMSWQPAAGASVPGSSEAAQYAAAYSPPAGTFQWNGGYPSQLRSFWQQGSANELDTGAITGFEADHGLQTDGIASSAVWTDLLKAAAADQRDTHGYSYAIASQVLPETLTIWHNGHRVFQSLANTGISIRPTPVYTSPVYSKLPFQVMQGTNPDGSHYADPVEWVSYFNGGSAVHYFPRPGYGYPQSLGCVELPASTAEQAYGYLPYGTLVTVTPS
jgi:peptidoglycan hydrolase-like protein with peptidoglycan-binding domain